MIPYRNARRKSVHEYRKLGHGGAHGLGEGQGVQLASQLAAAGVAGVQHGFLVLGQGAGVDQYTPGNARRHKCPRIQGSRIW